MYEVVRSAVAYAGRWSKVRIDDVVMPDGAVAHREVVEQADAVAVIALDDAGRVVLLRQYRHPVGERLLELPAGKLDVAGEDRADAARRELAEEVGLAAGQLRELLTFHNSAGWTDESTTLYLATELTPCAAPDGFTAAHEEADLEVLRMPLADAVAAVVAGQVRDAKTALGLLLAAHQPEASRLADSVQ